MDRTEQELVRIEKVKELKEKGIDPFGSRFDVTSNSKEIKEYEKNILAICDKITNAQLPEEIEHSKMCEFCEYRKICL